ncbi:hypothetical protein DRQ05_02650 [bacterium]|nr:MAG: hypothetical protein DRQ05_02650 [bacterium]
MNRVNGFLAVLVFFMLSITLGCGQGSSLITKMGDEVVKGELVLDSIPEAPHNEEYRIGPGDQMDIVFPYNREFTQKDIVVRPDGKISLPHAGEIRVSGMTVSALDTLLASKYSDIIINPDVTVIVKKYQPQTVYVLGKVKSPGGFKYERGMTLLQAIALGRGVSDDAKENGVLVLRRIAPDHIVGMQIDLKQILGKNQFDLDIPLKPFDIVYVPKSKLASVEDYSETLFNILSEPAGLYLKGWQVANVKILYEFYSRSGRGF